MYYTHKTTSNFVLNQLKNNFGCPQLYIFCLYSFQDTLCAELVCLKARENQPNGSV